MNFTIIFQDNDLLVINKPASVTVNRSDTTTGIVTVQDWSEEYLQIPPIKAKTKIVQNDVDFRDYESEFTNRGGIVHRIDKETSGILLIAKNPVSFENLQRQFKERTIKKWYIALAHGKVVPESGEINIPVGRLPWSRKQFGIVAGGREAVTRYKVLKNYEYVTAQKSEKLSLIELYPETGRTHQIRVHLKYLNHPIFADFLYAGRKTANSDRKVLSRVFLHAQKIAFLHPRTKKHLTFESPIPEELQSFIDLLKISA